MTALDQITPLSAERLAEIKASIERAHTELGEVRAEGPAVRWRWSIPANPDRDTDLIVSKALEGTEVLIAEVERLNDAVNGVGGLSAGLPDSEEVARLRQAVNAYQDTIDRVRAVADRPVEHQCGRDGRAGWVRARDLQEALQDGET